MVCTTTGLSLKERLGIKPRFRQRVRANQCPWDADDKAKWEVVGNGSNGVVYSVEYSGKIAIVKVAKADQKGKDEAKIMAEVKKLQYPYYVDLVDAFVDPRPLNDKRGEVYSGLKDACCKGAKGIKRKGGKELQALFVETDPAPFASDKLPTETPKAYAQELFAKLPAEPVPDPLLLSDMEKWADTEENQFQYMLMEKCDGVLNSFKEVAEYQDLLYTVVQAVWGNLLAYQGPGKLLHRDFHPGNIFRKSHDAVDNLVLESVIGGKKHTFTFLKPVKYDAKIGDFDKSVMKINGVDVCPDGGSRPVEGEASHDMITLRDTLIDHASAAVQAPLKNEASTKKIKEDLGKGDALAVLKALVESNPTLLTHAEADAL